MSPLQLSPELQVSSAQYKTSPAERQWQQQSVSYLLSLSLIPSLAAVPGICPWNEDLGSALPTHRASLLFLSYRKRFFSAPRLPLHAEHPLISKRNIKIKLGRKEITKLCLFLFLCTKSCCSELALQTWMCNLAHLSTSLLTPPMAG